MYSLVKSASMIGLVAGALALAGCATTSSVEHAQATADQAMSQAQAAASAAQKAQSTADAAAADAQKANTRLNTVESDVDHLAHHHEHGTMKNVGVKHPAHKRMPKPEPATTTPDAPK